MNQVNKKSRSILEEISRYVPPGGRDQIIESRGQAVVATVLNFFELLESTYPDDVAQDLKNRMISSIRGSDPDRFVRALKKAEKSNESSS